MSSHHTDRQFSQQTPAYADAGRIKQLPAIGALVRKPKLKAGTLAAPQCRSATLRPCDFSTDSTEDAATSCDNRNTAPLHQSFPVDRIYPPDPLECGSAIQFQCQSPLFESTTRLRAILGKITCHRSERCPFSETTVSIIFRHIVILGEDLAHHLYS
jgi:hypothetical protein